MENGRTVEKETLLKAIPYHTWNNRGPGNMVVWIPREKDAVIIKPEPAIASKSKPLHNRIRKLTFRRRR